MAIFGDGDIAKVLNDRKGALFFACGVSNSRCTDENEFERERNLLIDLGKRNINEHCLFYFSSIIKPLNHYGSHKIMMESLIDLYFQNYNIIRLGNIDFGTNPHTFINYIKAKLDKCETVEIKDEYKFMISKEQLLLITDNLPLKGKNIISVFGDMKKVKDCL
jgi:UDP-2-acetamido-2,6-beta-L-arabino-hexul-4-ose reductase